MLQVPLIQGALAQIECVTSEIFMSGDHAIVVGQVEGASTHTPDERPDRAVRRPLVGGDASFPVGLWIVIAKVSSGAHAEGGRSRNP